jgi:hypothetical protein
MRTSLLAATLVAVTLSVDGCTLRATPSTPSTPTIESASSSRAPGTYLLDIATGTLSQEVRLVGGPRPTGGWACLANRYPIDATAAFTNAARDALGQVVERVEPGSGAAQSGAARSGAAGVVTIRPTRFDPSASIIPGLLGPTAQGAAAIEATVTVEGPGGRFETSIAGYGNGAQQTHGLTGCAIRGEAGAAATERAIADFAQRLATRLADAPELRGPARPAPAPVRTR